MTSFLIRLSVDLLLLTIAFQQSVLPAEAVEYYVTPVLPNPKCPADQPCLELDQFALNSSLYFSDQDSVTLHFLDGDHILMQELNFTGIEKLLWLGNLNETLHVQIQCGAAITFNNVSELVMRKLSIKSVSAECSGLTWTTLSCILEEVMIMSMEVNISSEGIVFITNSTFIKSSLIAPHKANITHSSFNRRPGTGVTISIKLPQQRMNSTYNGNGEITIHDTFFSEHRLGGLMVIFQEELDIQTSGIPPMLSIENCTFSYNAMASGTDSGSYLASALTVLGSPGLINISISRSSFLGNIDARNIPITVFIASNNVTVTNCVFSANTGTALKAYNSHVFISEEVNFMSNSAYEGGGMVLVNSYLHLFKNASVTFSNNTAQHVGGGILVKQESLTIDPTVDSQQPLCFYQIDNESENVSVNMIDNSAKHGGDHIYGASLKSQCRVNNNTSDDAESYKVWENVFHFKAIYLQYHPIPPVCVSVIVIKKCQTVLTYTRYSILPFVFPEKDSVYLQFWLEMILAQLVAPFTLGSFHQTCQIIPFQNFKLSRR